MGYANFVTEYSASICVLRFPPSLLLLQLFYPKCQQDPGSEVFVHYKDIKMVGFKALEDGQRVIFVKPCATLRDLPQLNRLEGRYDFLYPPPNIRPHRALYLAAQTKTLRRGLIFGGGLIFGQEVQGQDHYAVFQYFSMSASVQF